MDIDYLTRSPEVGLEAQIPSQEGPGSSMGCLPRHHLGGLPLWSPRGCHGCRSPMQKKEFVPGFSHI